MFHSVGVCIRDYVQQLVAPSLWPTYGLQQVYNVQHLPDSSSPSPSVIMTTKKVEFVNHKYTPVLSETSKYLTLSESLSIHHECRNKRI